MKKPKWLDVADQLMAIILPITSQAIESKKSASNVHISIIPELALYHLTGCLDASAIANGGGMHSVAVCLVRQCVETITVIDVGLQEDKIREPLLIAWDEGKKSHGDIRRLLESKVWPSYGNGLWDEPWGEYFGNLAHAVQPYAHYTPELRGWQLAVRSYDGKTKFLVEVGPKSYDPVRALRISLLHALVVWTLGRIVIINHTFSNSGKVASLVSELGKLLGASKLLFKSKNWADEIAPHVLFLPGKSYVDD